MSCSTSTKQKPSENQTLFTDQWRNPLTYWRRHSRGLLTASLYCCILLIAIDLPLILFKPLTPLGDLLGHIVTTMFLGIFMSLISLLWQIKRQSKFKMIKVHALPRKKLHSPIRSC